MFNRDEPPARPAPRPAPRPVPVHDERREHLRIPEPPAEVSGDWMGVVDISTGGICLNSRAPLTPGEELTLIVTDAELYYTESLDAEVMWSTGERVGLRWTGLNEKQEEWLEERCRRWQEEALSAQIRPTQVLRPLNLP